MKKNRREEEGDAPPRGWIDAEGSEKTTLCTLKLRVAGAILDLHLPRLIDRVEPLKALDKSTAKVQRVFCSIWDFLGMPRPVLATHLDELLLGLDFLLRRTATPLQGFHFRLQFFRAGAVGFSTICPQNQTRAGGIQVVNPSCSIFDIIDNINIASLRVNAVPSLPVP